MPPTLAPGRPTGRSRRDGRDRRPPRWRSRRRWARQPPAASIRGPDRPTSQPAVRAAQWWWRSLPPSSHSSAAQFAGADGPGPGPTTTAGSACSELSSAEPLLTQPCLRDRLRRLAAGHLGDELGERRGVQLRRNGVAGLLHRLAEHLLGEQRDDVLGGEHALRVLEGDEVVLDDRRIRREDVGRVDTAVLQRVDRDRAAGLGDGEVAEGHPVHALERRYAVSAGAELGGGAQRELTGHLRQIA